MDLHEGLKHVLDQNAIILFGAGASYGARNPYGEFPSGKKLAGDLYAKCGITPDNPWDLADASQSFLDRFQAHKLILEIRDQLNCVSYTNSHTSIFSLPWFRYYTTNYDNISRLSVKDKKIIIPVCLSDDPKTFLSESALCVHINGDLDRLDESTLLSEFKLTAGSYEAQENILNSRWGACLANDLDAAKCIFIVGLSLDYDLDLRKILHSSSYKDKTVIIDRPDLSDNAFSKLSRFGTVYKIGIDAFATEIDTIRSTYNPHVIAPEDRVYSCFDYSYRKSYSIEVPSPDCVFDLIFNGSYDDRLFYPIKSGYMGIINRKKVDEIKDEILSKRRVVVIHSDMGNGKTTVLSLLQKALSAENIHLFSLVNADSPKLSEEINAIHSLSHNSQVVVFIDDYPNYPDVVDKFSKLDTGEIQFVFTARTARNSGQMPELLRNLNVMPNESAVFDVNLLSNNELKDCVRLFNYFGLFGEMSSKSDAEKLAFLRKKWDGGKRFQNILLCLFRSKARSLTRRIDSLISVIRKGSSQYHDAVLLSLLAKIMNLRLSVRDIERITSIDISSDARFKSDPAIQELLCFDDNGRFTLKSPVTAKYILQNVTDTASIIQTMVKVTDYAAKYSDLVKFRTLLQTIASYSLISSFARGFPQYENYLLNYFDELSKNDYYRNSNFFWLQYAIACIETGRYERAEQYLETARSLIPAGFDPFQINNQQARFYLKRIQDKKADSPLDDFLEAHRLLMLPITSPRDDELTVILTYWYYTKKEVIHVMNNSTSLPYFRNACREAANRTRRYIDLNPNGDPRTIDLWRNLVQLTF